MAEDVERGGGGARREPGTPGAESPGPQAGPADTAAEAELTAWLALGGQAVAVVEQMAALLRLEIGLAVADGMRLLVVILAMVPLVLLAWLGVTVLVSWLAYAASASVTLGLAVFLLQQLGMLLLLWRAALRFQQSFGLHASRRQWRALVGGAGSAAGNEAPPA